MPVSNIISKKVGRELLEWVHLGVRTGMRRAVADYRQRIAAGDTLNAVRAIKYAVNQPHMTRARINYAITIYGQQALVDAVTAALPGGVTLAEVNADLTAMENYAQGLVNHRNTDGWTWDQIATDIETNVELENVRWVFQVPPGYTSIWGD